MQLDLESACIGALARAHHGDPFSVLGAHRIEGGWAFRAWIQDATNVRIRINKSVSTRGGDLSNWDCKNDEYILLEAAKSKEWLWVCFWKSEELFEKVSYDLLVQGGQAVAAVKGAGDVCEKSGGHQGLCQSCHKSGHNLALSEYKYINLSLSKDDDSCATTEGSSSYISDTGGNPQMNGVEPPSLPPASPYSALGDLASFTVIKDPYSFGLILNPSDIEQFIGGSLWNIDDVMGSHLTRVEGCVGARFAVWAPAAQFVSVVGDWNAWDGRAHVLRRREGGLWEGFVPLACAGACYGYRIHTAGTDRVKIDAFAQEFEVPPRHGSLLSDQDDAYRQAPFVWTDRKWLEQRGKDGLGDKTRRRPMSIYECHLQSWLRDGKGFRELAPILCSHLLSLNFTHIEFLPLNQHPFEGSWGYQVSGFYGLHSSLGRPDDFKYLVNLLHANNIGVFMDWVPAHFVADSWALAKYDGSALYEYPDEREGLHKQWGTLAFNYARTEVRNFLLGSAYHWIRRYHIDGLRIDAVSCMLYKNHMRPEGAWVPNKYGGVENLEAISLLKELNWVIHKKFPGVYTMAEESTSWQGVTRRTIRSRTGGETQDAASPLGNSSKTRPCTADHDSPISKGLPDIVPCTNAAVVASLPATPENTINGNITISSNIELHYDDEWNPGVDDTLGFDAKWDLGWMNDVLAYLCTPAHSRGGKHAKLTFRGLYADNEKWVLPLSHDEVVNGKGSLLDKCGYRDVPFWERLQNLKVLLAFQVTLPGRPLIFMGAEFGQGREWDWKGPLHWHESREELRARHRDFLADLLGLYKSRGALHAGDDESWNFRWADCDNAGSCVLAYLRSYEAWKNDVLVVLNFSPNSYKDYAIRVPHGVPWRCLLNSDDWKYAGDMKGCGNGVTMTPRDGCLWLTLPKYSAYLFEPISKET